MHAALGQIGTPNSTTRHGSFQLLALRVPEFLHIPLSCGVARGHSEKVYCRLRSRSVVKSPSRPDIRSRRASAERFACTRSVSSRRVGQQCVLRLEPDNLGIRSVVCESLGFLEGFAFGGDVVQGFLLNCFCKGAQVQKRFLDLRRMISNAGSSEDVATDKGTTCGC